MRQRKSKIRKPRGFSDDGASFAAPPRDRASSQQTVELGAAGRLVIPAPMRAALGMKVGDKLTVRLEDDQLSIYTAMAGIHRAQKRLAPYLPNNAVDHFLRWKRQEAAREAAEMDRWTRGE